MVPVRTVERRHTAILPCHKIRSPNCLDVDFLCAEARVVIEVDGGQHLADAEAYRRDRRKDVLLQQNGYFVLRFLAEDVGKHLDQVLDTILAALVYRENSKRR